MGAAGTAVTGLSVDEVTAANLDLTWAGPTLSLDLGTYRIYEDGSLAPLYQASRTIGKLPGWSTEKVLAFILTDALPQPRSLSLDNQVGQRRPKPLSFDHIALLQLMYMTPSEAWSGRLRMWDRWRETFPEEGFRLDFQGKKSCSNLPTTENQRIAWMRREGGRAYDRALKFVSYIDG